MRNNPFIEKLLVETQAFTDLEQPVILASGELGIYYVNTEKLSKDNGKWEQYGNDSLGMIYHSVITTQNNPSFKEVINQLSEGVQSLFPIKSNQKIAVSGGQRRDWIFSGPIAHQLQVPHISLYKDGKVELIDTKNGGSTIENPQLDNYKLVHVVDLITKGSSIYHSENGKEKGWVPMLRERGASIDHLVAVVTRNQDGERLMARQGVIVHPMVSIDEKFLEKYSNNPERALAYNANPHKWTCKYLEENGAAMFADYFDPQKGKQDRAFKMLDKYRTTDGLAELESVVNQRYGIKFK